MGHPNSGSTQGKPVYGRRIFVSLVDDIASQDPSRIFLAIPRSTDPQDGWQDLTFGQYANAVNRFCHWIVDQVGLAREGEYPTMAYIGPTDVRYLIVLAAAVKTGYKILFISPRNSFESQLFLFENTKCQWLCHAHEYSQQVQSWLLARPMKSTIVSRVSDLLQGATAPAFPYRKTFSEACSDPAMILHTSGSTGTPKPIICRHGMIALGDAYHEQPEFSGYSHFLKAFSERASRVLCAMPLFHALGLYFCVSLSIYWNTPLVLPVADLALTADTVRIFLEASPADAAILPPSILADMSHKRANIEALKRLSFVVTGGGSLEAEAGDRLVDAGVVISNGISTTEYGIYPIYFQPNPKLWKYFIFNNDIFGCDYRQIGDNAYEQVIVRTRKDPGLQGIFYTFPDLVEYHTKDLYRPHPTLAHHWVHLGRADDIIVFSNGEKLNPMTIESTVGHHPDIKRVMVVGQGKFQAGMILEPFTFPTDDTMAQRLINDVWPLIQQSNTETVAHGRIARHMIRLSDPAKPVPCSSKGALQRGAFLKLYGPEINAIYDAVYHQETVRLDFASKSTLINSIKGVLKSLLVPELGLDTDFFNAGVDSLQAINMSRLLGFGLQQHGVPAEQSKIAPKVIYGNPTLSKMAEYLFQQVSGGAPAPTHILDGIDAAKALLDKYDLGGFSDDFNEIKPLLKPWPAGRKQTVLLTGSTGSLGSYLLDLLEASTSVTEIYCLNRASDGGLKKQLQVNKERGLCTSFIKTKFLQADLTHPCLGMDHITYTQLLASTDRVIHNAWSVNFNLSIESFEPSIKGVRHLANFSFRAHKRVPIIFISSIGTVTNWTLSEQVPETLLTDMSLASPGYGESKLIGELILSQAAEKLGLPVAVLRVGQIAGPRSEQGMWNKHEWLPTIIASSVCMGRLPYELGSLDMVDWVCIEDVAATVLEIAGIIYPQPLSTASGHFHVVNPTQVPWRDLALSVKEFYEEQGCNLELVSLPTWVDSVEESLKSDTTIPGVKLLDTYKSLVANTEKEHITLSTVKTRTMSVTLNNMRPIDPKMMKLWCRQWGF